MSLLFSAPLTSNQNVDEYGEVLYFDVHEDISSATTYQVTIKDPDGNETTKTATLEASDTATDYGTFTGNQHVSYTTVATDFDEEGRWKIRAKITFASRVAYTNWQLQDVKT